MRTGIYPGAGKASGGTKLPEEHCSGGDAVGRLGRGGGWELRQYWLYHGLVGLVMVEVKYRLRIILFESFVLVTNCGKFQGLLLSGGGFGR